MDTLKQELHLMLVDQGKRLNVIRYYSYQGFSYFILLIVALIWIILGSLIPNIMVVPATIMGLLVLAIVILNVIWMIRRLHDLNLSGYWILFPFVFLLIAMILAVLPGSSDSSIMTILIAIVIGIYVIGYLGIFILTLIPGTKGINKYGEVPQENNFFNYIFLVVFIIACILIIIAEMLQPDTKDGNGNQSNLSNSLQQKMQIMKKFVRN